MTLDRSIEIMQKYGVALGIDDDLNIVESMVKNYSVLLPEQRHALEFFMEVANS